MSSSKTCCSVRTSQLSRVVDEEAKPVRQPALPLTWCAMPLRDRLAAERLALASRASWSNRVDVRGPRCKALRALHGSW
ncbi:hypothetical protein RA210_U330013 [Rubrivivax sp. A210]|nr:hypothetical protein RA210_U330013 [Rubrivivax sp. A210]